jgi:hypothetical protein
MTAPRFAGDGSLSNLDAFGLSVLTMTGQYDATIPSNQGTAQPTGILSSGTSAPGKLETASAKVTGRASFVKIFGQAIQDAAGTIALDSNRADFDLMLAVTPARRGQLAGAVLLHPDRQALDLLNFTATIGETPWRLIESGSPPTVSWSDAGIAITPASFATGHEDDQRIDIAGTSEPTAAGLFT